MASAVWPAGLPQAPQLRALRERPPELTVRTSMDVGPAKVRRRQTAGVRTFPIEIKLTRDQVALLDEFFLDTLAGGALAFQWTQHRTGDLIDYRFLGPPEYAPLAPRQSGSEYWMATFSIEALPGTLVVGDPPDPPDDPPGGGGNYSEGMTAFGGGGDDDGDRSPRVDAMIEEPPMEEDAPEPDVYIEVILDHSMISPRAGDGDNLSGSGDVGGASVSAGDGVDAGPGDVVGGGNVGGFSGG